MLSQELADFLPHRTLIESGSDEIHTRSVTIRPQSGELADVAIRVDITNSSFWRKINATVQEPETTHPDIITHLALSTTMDSHTPTQETLSALNISTQTVIKGTSIPIATLEFSQTHPHPILSIKHKKPSSHIGISGTYTLNRDPQTQELKICSHPEGSPVTKQAHSGIESVYTNLVKRIQHILDAINQARELPNVTT